MRFTAVLAATVLAACSPRPAPPPAAGAASGAPVPGVISGEVAAQLAARGARVVDVRTPQEFAAGHVPGAINVPFDELAGRTAELGDPSRPVVLYCRSGRRSGIAARTLRGLGFDAVYDFQRYADWPAGGQ